MVEIEPCANANGSKIEVVPPGGILNGGRVAITVLGVAMVLLAGGCRPPDPSEARANSLRLRPNRAEDVTRRPVDIGGDFRPSWVTPAGGSFDFSAEAPEGAELRFAYAVLPDPEPSVPLRVWSVTDPAERLLLWESPLQSETEAVLRGWNETAVRLPPAIGPSVRLQIETMSTATNGAGMVALASPRIINPTSVDSRPNIVLIVIDTLRADHMSLYGYPRPTTPGIDAWAHRRGLVFKTAVSQSPWTMPSHISLFTGLDTLNHGLNYKENVPDSITTLAEVLGAAGYETKAITGGVYLGPETNLMQGFDSVEYWFHGDTDRDQRANDITHNTERARQWLAGADEGPFFLFFHTYEVHAPYRARKPFFSRFHDQEGYLPDLKAIVSLSPPEEVDGFQEHYAVSKAYRRPDGTPMFTTVGSTDSGRQLVRDLYDSGVAFADAHVSRLLERLAETGLEEHTVVILTSDHGESLSEADRAGHCSLASVELLVPLIVALPDGAHHGDTVDTQVRLVDVAPTIFDLVGITAPPGLDGTSLMPLLSGRSFDFPQEAWSYAGSSNYGAALRLANGVSYTFNDAVLPPLHGQEEFERRDEAGGELADFQREELRRRMRSALEDRSSGVHVRLQSRGSQPLQCTLRGRMVEPNRIKAVTLPEGGVGWSNDQLEISLDPGESLTLSLQGRVIGGLDLAARVGEKRLEQTLELEEFAGHWYAAVVDSRWEIGGGTNDGRRSSIHVWIQGNQPSDDSSDPDFDEATLEQLRQLGYLPAAEDTGM